MEVDYKSVVEVVEQMNEDVKVRDEEKAALYVATVRPAMAPTRYLAAEPVNERPTANEECDERGGGMACETHPGGEDEAGTGEGGDGVETGEGAELTNSVHSKELKKTEGTDEDPSSDERSVASVALSREERKKLRKQKKRRSMKARLVKQREAEQQAKNVEQSAIQEQLNERQKVATETLKLHEAKERTKTATDSDGESEQRAAARVSLVKRR
ncbi:hypothetical protein L916_21239 [Phytophthora nicotianae]|uniref:Uncharacterized protein n=2 Tax=Phytophthora nicotianae TaxID=4792 RepID=W2HUF0_PHYNI|nr:hypothetical protein L916_21239 [Phytophthora nicotianae]